VWEGVLEQGNRLGRRGAVRLMAGAAAVAAGSAVLAACGGPSVPGAVATNGSGAPTVAAAKETVAASMVQNKSGTITLVARGSGIGATAADNTTFYFGGTSTDGTWSCQIKSQGSSNPNSLAGIMARDSGDPGAEMVGVFITPTNGVTFRWRSGTAQAGQTWPMQIAIGVAAPIWLQLKKAGDNFTVAYSTDGKTYSNQTSISTTFTNTSWLVGLAACSLSASATGLDVFTNCTGFKPTRYLDINAANQASSSSK